jgi:hypothetical protein
MDRCFWEELSTGISIYKNDEIIEYLSVTLTVGLYQIAPYGYRSHKNNAPGKELIFLNTATNNFLEGMNYNHTYKPLNKPERCIEDDVAMPKIRTINRMPNIPACSTIISLKASDIISVTNFCSAVKLKIKLVI